MQATLLFKAWAKVTVVNVAEADADGSSRPAIEPLQVASCQIPTSVDNLIELVDIPDVVGDLNRIQTMLATQKDPAKMLIWMDVFKRSVIKTRPIKPFVKVCKMLPVATSRTPHIFNNFGTFSKIPPKTIPTARALHTFVCDSRPKTVQKERI